MSGSGLSSDLGADITFLEAPTSVEQMQAYCDAVPGPKLANMLEGGHTPILSPTELEIIGFTIAACASIHHHSGAN